MVDTSYYTVSMFQDSQQRCSPGCYSEQKILPAGIVFTNTQNLNKLSLLFCFYDDHSFPDVLKDDLKSIEFLLQFMMITPFLMS